MRRRAVEAAGHPVEHVADVADERPRYRRRVNPSRGSLHLQSPDVVLLQDGEHAVVGVLADAPFRPRGGRLARRIVEDAEKDQRVARDRSWKYEASRPRLSPMPSISACPSRVMTLM